MKYPRNIEDAIADFQGLPRPSEHEWDAGPQGIDSLVEVLIQRFSIGRERPEQVIMANWRELVGDRNANRCAPERIDSENRLVVAVANPVLRRELHFARAQIVRKLKKLKGCHDIRDIEFRAG
jgi:hypothetical protein